MSVNSKKAMASAGALEAFRAYLSSQGLRYTPQRRIVLDQTLGRGGHFDAEELYESCRRAGQNVSRATVYRALGHLRDCGLVKEVLREQGRSCYETVYGHEHHDHMLCMACGRVIEFCDDRIEDLQQRICRRHGFKPLDHRMGIRGLCRDCRRAKRREDS